uniref:FERM domain-containing protein n=1 Tax=Acrobeloides nanus TaxID=290746 RepID=A0A914D4R7_9BILA
MHRNFKGLTSTETEAKFLESASRLSTYGFDPYVVRDAKLNVEITIGITCRGIMIYLQNSQIHYLQWEDLSKVDYSGKQLRIYPEQSYLDRYQPGSEQMTIGDLFLKSTLYVT